MFSMPVRSVAIIFKFFAASIMRRLTGAKCVMMISTSSRYWKTSSLMGVPSGPLTSTESMEFW